LSIEQLPDIHVQPTFRLGLSASEDPTRPAPPPSLEAYQPLRIPNRRTVSSFNKRPALDSFADINDAAHFSPDKHATFLPVFGLGHSNIVFRYVQLR
jgi:hypothetical protein